MKNKKANASPEQSRRAKRQKRYYCLIILNGEISKPQLIKYSGRKNKILISADGASNTLYKWKIIPDYIIGDLDSLTPEAFAYFKKNKVIIKKIIEQEHTDFEKCLRFSISKKIKNITVTGFGGKRADHFLNNFSVMKRYYKKCNLRLIDKNFEIFFSGKITAFECRIGDTVSLIALPKASGITTYGLKFPLKNETLQWGIREGALNEAVKKIVKIEVKKGDLIVFKEI
jgi:thiamine pyrophosphokinase